MNLWTEKLKGLVSRPGVKNASKLLSASVFSQALAVVVAPVVTRLYTPESYGFLAIVISFSSILGVMATLQFHQTILLPRADEDAMTALTLSIWITAFFFFLSLSVIGISYPYLSGWFKFQTTLLPWFWFVPFIVLASGASNIATYWSNRKQRYRALSRARILSSITASSCSIGIGFFDLGPSGLVIGFFSSYFVLNLMLWPGILSEVRETLPFKDKDRLVSWAKRYKGFPLYTLPSEFIHMLLVQLPVFMLTGQRGPEAAGFYSLSNRVLGMPSAVIASVGGELFKQRAASEYAQNGYCERTFLKFLGGLLSLAILPFGALILFGPWLFETVFGPQWRESGAFTQVMAFMFFFRFSMGPVANMYFIVGALKEDLFVQIYRLASSVVIFVILSKSPILVVLGAFVANNVLTWLYIGYRSWGFAKGNVHPKPANN